ncbi:HAMP domain-containing histidine kinase [Ihubacter massiliensis]|uniref:histidine kinase n=1 Tax=Hominibacterium faecale TaxID=2839743 RepID=A0A9J6QUP3_9FIRM|nr:MULTISPECIES: HAMP domain-containing sensor histidine kinase [Eubacteriales Family XIII. Incertae Sedis]MCO7123797.1 HAMP domain-containing histidine kinase [Ihubacter massiliensis]MCU7378723.1 HAMP domain-containing histidine kinase [Hominibacterium faecale]
MNEQRQISNKWFYKVYGIYGAVFILICAGLTAVCFLDIYIRFIVPAALALLALTAVLFVLHLKQGVLLIFDQCNELLDQAIAGSPLPMVNEETELAAFAVKLARFVAMRDKAFQDAKVQKNQIETLLADISHQTKTPIANILLYSQLIAERSLENRELIEKLASQSEKLQFLIRRLVEMSRLENGIIRCDVREGQLRDFLLQVIGDYYDKAQGKNQEILLECPQDAAAVFDSKWLREAVGNIVDNGIKYTPIGGNIKLSVTIYEMFARIDISDTGRGITEEDIPKIFERFYRGADAAADEGLGLGLYLAREMISAQRGYIKVSSEPEKGSCFSVFIPAFA